MKRFTLFTLIFLLHSISLFAQKKEYYKQIAANYFEDIVGTYSITETESKSIKHYQFVYNRAGDIDYILKSDSSELIRYYYIGNNIDVIRIFDKSQFSLPKTELLDAIVFNDMYGYNSYRVVKFGKEYKEKMPLKFVEFPDTPQEGTKIVFEKMSATIYKFHYIPLYFEAVQDYYDINEFYGDFSYRTTRFNMSDEMVPMDGYEFAYSKITRLNKYYQFIRSDYFDIENNKIARDNTEFKYDENGYQNEAHYIEEDGDPSNEFVYREDFSKVEIPVKTVTINDKNGNWIEQSYLNKANKLILDPYMFCAKIVRELNEDGLELKRTYYLENGELGTYDILKNENLIKAYDYLRSRR